MILSPAPLIAVVYVVVFVALLLMLTSLLRKSVQLVRREGPLLLLAGVAAGVLSRVLMQHVLTLVVASLTPLSTTTSVVVLGVMQVSLSALFTSAVLMFVRSSRWLGATAVVLGIAGLSGLLQVPTAPQLASGASYPLGLAVYLLLSVLQWRVWWLTMLVVSMAIPGPVHEVGIRAD